MDKEIFDGLVESIKQAVAISRGERMPGRVIRVEPVIEVSGKKYGWISQYPL